MSDSQTKDGSSDAANSRNGSIELQAGFNFNRPSNSHQHHKREPSHRYFQIQINPKLVHSFIFFSRVFVNRSLQLSKIKFFGFDMDYTLAGIEQVFFSLLRP